MNILNSTGRLSSINIIKSYLPCCVDTNNILNYNHLLVSQEVKTPTSCKNGLFITAFRGHRRLVPALWTQVRFQKGYPRFHNDLCFPNMDHYRKKEFIDTRKTKWGMGDEKKGYAYTLGAATLIAGAYGTKCVLTQFITYMAAAKDVVAAATVEIDVSSVASGKTATFKWRGKPLFIKNRSAADRAAEDNTPMNALKDPATLEQRCKNPDWLVVIGICTHLGCIPVANLGDYSGGFYCPCHGSHYDNLGRIRKGPAPTNLELPPYEFVSDTVILVG